MNSDVDQHAEPPPPGNFGPLVFLLAGFAMIDVMAPTAVSGWLGGELAAGVVFGVIAGQVGFLAFWAVLGPQRPLVRFSIALATAGTLYLVFVIGMALQVAQTWGWDWELFGWALAGLLLLPLLALAPLGPIWIRKWMMGCRMVRLEIEPAAEEAAEPSGHEEDPYALSSARQFSLGQILVLTTFVAIALGLASSFVKIVETTGFNEPWQVWLGLSIYFFVFSLASALVVLPCMWAALTARSRIASAIIFGVHTGILWLGLSVAEFLLSGPTGLWAVVVLLLFTVSMTGTLLISLRTIRHCGYELSWPRKRAADTTPARRALIGILEAKNKPWPHGGMSPFAWLAIVSLFADLVLIPLAWSCTWLAYDFEVDLDSWMALRGSRWILSIAFAGVRAGSLGLLAGQAALLAVWAAFGRERLWVRLLGSTGAAIIPWGTLIVLWSSWARPFYGRPSFPSLLPSLFFLPTFLLSMQLPVWVLRFRSRYCRIAGRPGEAPPVPAWVRKFAYLFPIGIMYVMLYAVLLVLAEWPPSKILSGWLPVLTLLVASSFWSVFMIWPCVRVTLLPENRPNLGLWLFSCTVVTTVMTIPHLGLLGILFNLTAVAVLFGCLRFVGNRGYFLARPE